MLRKYRAAISERNAQKEAHRGFSKQQFPNTVASWELMCSVWDADGFPKSLPNPFQMNDSSEFCGRKTHVFNSKFMLLDINEEQIQDQLDKKEAAALRATGRMALHQMSVSSFLAMGLELEESRYAVCWNLREIDVTLTLEQTMTTDVCYRAIENSKISPNKCFSRSAQDLQRQTAELGSCAASIHAGPLTNSN